MIDHDFYGNHVYPHLKLPLSEKYPQVSLQTGETHHSLAEHSVLMLVALTGTGKSTTFNKLWDISNIEVANAMKVIPSRREIADWIAIPTAQVLLSEPIQPVTDRVQRFHYTRTFADHVAGGMAGAFSWVNIKNSYSQVIWSEGIRGENEIRFALEHCPGWKIIELALHPITRLQRLSSRDDVFDQAKGTGDVSFLPDEMQAEAKALLQTGDISTKALTIMQAESESYGLYPFADGEHFANYHCIQVDNLTPYGVAEKILSIMNDSPG